MCRGMRRARLRERVYRWLGIECDPGRRVDTPNSFRPVFPRRHIPTPSNARLVIRSCRLGKNSSFTQHEEADTLGSKQHMDYKVESGNNGVYITKGMG